MESPLKIILVTVFMLLFKTGISQNEKAFCKAVNDENFNKVERMVKKLVREHRTIQAGSGFTPALDAITNWLKNQPCVQDAFWDKCQIKTAIYPGSASIGVRFKTKTGITEKCFHIQLGTTGQANLFGWKPRLSKAKNRLVYKKMYDCPNFIQQQKQNCAGE